MKYKPLVPRGGLRWTMAMAWTQPSSSPLALFPAALLSISPYPFLSMLFPDGFSHSILYSCTCITTIHSLTSPFSSFLCPCISLPSFSPSLSDHALYRCFFPSFFARPLSQYALIWLCKITFQVQQLSVFRAFSHSLPSPLIQPFYIHPAAFPPFRA